jgi:hypothetical protein
MRRTDIRPVRLDSVVLPGLGVSQDVTPAKRDRLKVVIDTTPLL